MQWATRVVQGGRTFLRRILDSLKTLQRPSHKLKLSACFNQDLDWWQHFLSIFNGVVACPTNSPITHVHVDASSTGSGVAFLDDWQYTQWSRDWPQASRLHINYKEVLSFVLAARRWAPLWSNHKVVIHTDSTTAMAIINKDTSCNP